MSIINSIAETINRYGNSVKIINKSKAVESKAFIQPLRYKNRVYIGGQYHRLGMRNTEKYLYIGLAENLLENNISVIEMGNNKYIVRRCETYYLKDCPIYVWAILLPYGERLEDDYESN